MGTWSCPIFATTSRESVACNPSEIEIVIGDLPPDDVKTFKHCAFFQDYWNQDKFLMDDTVSCNLTEFMDTHCDTHKLMDHMTFDVIKAWLSLFHGSNHH